jgi:ammonia channel protein AmtB
MHGYLIHEIFFSGKSAGMAMLVTHIAASTTCFFWMIIEWLHKGNPTLVGAVSGAITGLVVITPASGYVDQTGAFAMGLLGAICCYPAVVVKNKLSLDEKASISDYPDAFGVHAIGGMVGAFWTGMFANPDINSQSGAFYFNDKRLAWQIVAIIFVVLWSATLTAILMLILKFTIGINVAEPAEPDSETDQKSPDQKAETFQYFLPNTPPPAFQTMQYHPVAIPVTGTAVFGPPSFQHPLVPIGAAMVPMGPPMHSTPPPMHAPHGSHGYA